MTRTRTTKSAPATRRSSQDPLGVVFPPTWRWLVVNLLASLVPLRSRNLLFAKPGVSTLRSARAFCDARRVPTYLVESYGGDDA